MSSSTPLLDNTIEPDEVGDVPMGNISSPNKPKSARQQVVLTPGTPALGGSADAESGTTRHTAHNVHVTLTLPVRVVQG